MAAAHLLASKLRGFDIHISEVHHKAKKDAPSGTALRFRALMKEAYGGPLPITSVRAGGVVGEHTVLYAGPHETVELTHRAQSRGAFTAGALRAALWLKGRRPGIYDCFSMLDVRGVRAAGKRRG
jgi:4-hydroxy-tetrahydrodipicolinate reductase